MKKGIVYLHPLKTADDVVSCFFELRNKFIEILKLTAYMGLEWKRSGSISK